MNDGWGKKRGKGRRKMGMKVTNSDRGYPGDELRVKKGYTFGVGGGGGMCR